MDLIKIDSEGVYWINLAQDRVQRWANTYTAMSLRVLTQNGESLE
jgi:sugar lactone lactonase YvrE